MEKIYGIKKKCGCLQGTRNCLNLFTCQSGVDWEKMNAVTGGLGLGKVKNFKEFSSTGLSLFFIRNEHKKT